MRLVYKTFSSKKKKYNDDDDDEDEEKDDYIDLDINKRTAAASALGGIVGDRVGSAWNNVHLLKKYGTPEKALKHKRFLNGRKLAGATAGALGVGLAAKGIHELQRHVDGDDLYLKHAKRRRQSHNEHSGIITPAVGGAAGMGIGGTIGYHIGKKADTMAKLNRKYGNMCAGGLIGLGVGAGLGLAAKKLYERHNEKEIDKIDKLLYNNKKN